MSHRDTGDTLNTIILEHKMVVVTLRRSGFKITLNLIVWCNNYQFTSYFNGILSSFILFSEKLRLSVVRLENSNGIRLKIV